MGFAERISGAIENEERLLAWMKRNGWIAQAFGQGMLLEATRKALLRVEPPTPIRWMPDILAVKGKRVVLLDSKGGREDTPNVSLEDASSNAALALSTCLACEILYVWTGDLAISAEEARHVEKRPGPHGSAGSGTPYHLIRRDLLKPLHCYLDQKI